MSPTSIPTLLALAHMIVAVVAAGCYIREVRRNRMVNRNVAIILRLFIKNVREDTLERALHHVEWVADFLEQGRPPTSGEGYYYVYSVAGDETVIYGIKS